MCYQCLLLGADNLALGRSHALGQPALRTIPVEQLIARDFERFTKDQVLTDGVLDIYLHRPAGPVQVNGGDYGSQTIQTLAMDEEFVSFFQDAVQQLDAEIALDFRFVDFPEAADIRFYLDSEISLGGGGVTLGIALENDTTEKDFWEIMLNVPAFNGERDYLYYAALHELYHPLGGEHPFDSSDGDVFASRNSSRSAYPEETLMAYRAPIGNRWPTAFSFNDLAVLRTLWGSESGRNSTGNRLIGTAMDDILTGGPGSDLLRGEFGNDVLTGGGGRDELWGGQGSNQFFSGSDGAQDWLLISRDGSRNSRRNRLSVDEIAELGEEDRIGVIGTRSGRLRFGTTELKSRAFGTLDGIGIYVGKRLEAIYTGGELSRAELQDLTLGLPSGYAGDLG